MRKDLLSTLCIELGVTVLALFFRKLGINESNIIMAYILGVIVVAFVTRGYVYGIAASIMGVFLFNFIFTEPYYSLLTYRPDYPITFSIMLIVALLTSTLTGKVQRNARNAEERERMTHTLNVMARELLKAESMEEIAAIAGESIIQLYKVRVFIWLPMSSTKQERDIVYKTHDEYPDYALIQNIKKKYEKIKSNDQVKISDNLYYFPILGKRGDKGVLVVSPLSEPNKKELSKNIIQYIESVTSQMALAIDKEFLQKERQKILLDIETERMRGNVLRATSHDLRTPLTGIIGAGTTLLEQGEKLDNDTRQLLIKGILESGTWLMGTVENILQMTRLDDGRLHINKQLEVVEEIIAEVIERFSSDDKKAQRLLVDIPETPIFVEMDGKLIEQVLINLLENAYRYSPSSGLIYLRVAINEKTIEFSVLDEGPGISREDQEHMFERFYTGSNHVYQGRKGTGLGLAICKSIVDTHEGKIKMISDENKGTCVKFELPYGKGE